MKTEPSNRLRGGAFPSERPCNSPGCALEGAYRAPRHRPGTAAAMAATASGGPPEWQYFCLEHVRAFNAGWNFFEGMTADEIWEAQTPYPHWDTEAQAFARSAFGTGPDRVSDALGVLRWKHTAPTQSPLSAEDKRSLSVLGLPEDSDMPAVKAKYRQLARKYHPDANQGRRDQEGRFQKLSEAMAQLEQSPTFRAQASKRA